MGSRGAISTAEEFGRRGAAILCLCAAVLVCATTAARASPWTRSKNQFLFISRADYFSTDLKDISVDGALVDGEFERVETNNYIEYGLTDAITVGGKAFYGTNWLRRGSETETESGFSEIELFAQQQVYRDPRHAVAVKLTTAGPTAFTSGIRPDLENKDFDVEASALYGATIVYRPVRLFAAAEAGFRKRFGAPADQVRFLTTIGFEPSGRWVFMLDTFSIKSLENEAPGGVDFDVFKVRPSVSWRASSRVAVQAGIEEELAGRNIVQGRTFFIGLWTRF